MIQRLSKLSGRSILLAALLLLLTPTVALAAVISLDGFFDDWIGQPGISDPLGDSTSGVTDIAAFHWANNPGESNTYFMIERDHPGGIGNKAVLYQVYIDTNCNGSSSESADRLLAVWYDPEKSGSNVSMSIYSGSGSLVSSAGGDWGDSRGRPPDGGTRAEFYASFSDLGISTNQQICFSAASFGYQGDPTADDSTSTVTWTPVPAMGTFLLVVFILLAVILLWWRKDHLKWKMR